MTILGRYGNTSHAPYLDAQLILPSQGVRGTVSFLIDTGATSTVLAQVDSARLGIDHHALKKTTRSFGVGGASTDHVEPAILILADGTTLHVFDVQLTIMKPRNALATMPSLLGRDVINRLGLTLNYAKGNCHIEIIDSDGTW